MARKRGRKPGPNGKLLSTTVYLPASTKKVLESWADADPDKGVSTYLHEGAVLRLAWDDIRRASAVLDVIFEVVYKPEFMPAQTPEFSHMLYDHLAGIVAKITTNEVIATRGESAKEAYQDSLDLLRVLREWVTESDIEAGVDHTLDVIGKALGEVHTEYSASPQREPKACTHAEAKDVEG